MERRTCGKSVTMDLPVMCVGTWSFGGTAEDYWGAQDEAETKEMVKLSIAKGANFFDTAEMYNGGRSETALGKLLKDEGAREKCIIVDKIPPDACHEGEMRSRLEKALERMQTTYCDIYMVHWPFKAASVWKGEMPKAQDAFAALAALQKEGKIKHIGVSNFGVKQLTEALSCGVEILVNELPYSLFTRGIEFGLAELCKANNIGILAYSPLMQGLLTGKYKSAEELPAMRARTHHFKPTRQGSRHTLPGCEDELFKAIAELNAVAEREKMPLSDLAIAWVLANPAVVSVIAGCRNSVQLEQNMKAANLKLRPELVEELTKITEPVKAHTGHVIDYYASPAENRSE
eukprot:TRINITY_DN26858_c0_g1_i1.p1 TRINITY_DN26858_c0_g1~~TRINITY_DN26858_c0_g1_i1.p1  ORF type:complete len:359 (+),score=119.99 TRINITY_DN26858_c0_g1_i1:42-1079(+)